MQQSIVFVTGHRQRKLPLVDLGFERRGFSFEFRQHLGIIDSHFQQLVRILCPARQAIPELDLRPQGRELLHLLLGYLRVIPEVWGADLRLQVGQLVFFACDVKDAPGSGRPVRPGC